MPYSWHAPALAAAVLTAGCTSPDPPAELAKVVRLDDEERVSYERTIERLQGELRQANGRLAELEAAAVDAELGIDDGSALADCDSERKLLQQELERYQAGLQGAVAELNRQQQAAASADTRNLRGAEKRDANWIVASVQTEVTDVSSSWKRWAWTAQVRNTSDGIRRFGLEVQWVNAHDFVVATDREYNVLLGPRESRTVRGSTLIELEPSESILRARIRPID